MAKRLQDLPVANINPSGSYTILKFDLDGVPIDHRIDTATLFSDFVSRSGEIGTGVGQIPRLINDGFGNGTLPPMNGKNISNLTLPYATKEVRGITLLSDAINGTQGEYSFPPFAATPLAVKRVDDKTVDKAGDAMTGDLVFANTKGVTLKNTSGVTIDGLKLNSSNKLVLGDNRVNLFDLNVKDRFEVKGTGSAFFGVSSNGTIDTPHTFSKLQKFTSTSGIKSTEIVRSGYGDITASTVEGAIQQLHDQTAGIEWITPSSGSFTAQEGFGYYCTGRTVTLPANPESDRGIQFHDAEDTWHQTPLVLKGNGNTIEGLNEEFVADLQGFSFEVFFIDGTWRLTNHNVANATPSTVSVDNLPTNGTRTFVMSHVPPNPESILVVADGKVLRSSDFTFVGTTLTLDSSIPVPVDYLDVRHLGVKYMTGGSKVQLIFNGSGVISVVKEKGVLSVTDNGTGLYTIVVKSGINLLQSTLSATAKDASVSVKAISSNSVQIRTRIDDFSAAVDSSHITFEATEIPNV